MKSNRELYVEALNLIGKEILEVKQREFLLRLIKKHKSSSITTQSSSTSTQNEIDEIVNYLNQSTGKEFRANTPETRALIRARLKEGFKVDEFKKVIDIKSGQWLKNDQFKYLRPKTLFGSKFEGYLQEWIIDNKKRMYRSNEIVAVREIAESPALSKADIKKQKEWAQLSEKLLSQATPEDWKEYLAQEKLFQKAALSKGISDALIKNLYVQFLKTKKGNTPLDPSLKGI